MSDIGRGVPTIPPIVIQILKKMFNLWLIGQLAIKKQLQKLLCNLLYINRCVTQALLSCNRLLALLCQMPARGQIKKVCIRTWHKYFTIKMILRWCAINPGINDFHSFEVKEYVKKEYVRIGVALQSQTDWIVRHPCS